MESHRVPRTDPKRWRLLSKDVDHRWLYLRETESIQSEQSDAERYLLGLPVVNGESNQPTKAAMRSFDDTARAGFDFFRRLQLPEGHWVGDYGGPSFLLPGLIFAISTVFSTGLYYVVLRILGMEKDHALARRARDYLLSLGGACRVVYLPTSYLWSNRCTTPLTPLLAEIRDEIYTQPYASTAFINYRNYTAETDAMRKVSPLLLFFFVILSFWCNLLCPKWLLRMANNKVSELMRREEQNTNFNCLAPVNKAFHMAATVFEDGPSSERLRQHREHLYIYLWMGPDAFAIQASVEAGLAQDQNFMLCLEKAHHFLDISQLRDNLKDPHRQPRKGGWLFSTRSNGYIVSDCAAESLKAVLLLQNVYEKIRGSKYLELLNPAEVFDKIMVEYSYPECTTAVLTALSLFTKYFPRYRKREIDEVIQAAVRYVRSVQEHDGGWGEHYRSCLERRYIHHDTSQVVNTAWALIGDRQQHNGEWLQESVEGVFNKTCMIGYPNYKFYFPIMALGAYSQVYLPKLKG
ncbi:terpene synthase [Biscogniauxia marginata]|nr:terpene synthase [Biscogniauxia marginata]